MTNRSSRPMGCAPFALRSTIASRRCPRRPDPSADALWGESLYFPPRYRGVMGSILACAAANPITFVRLAVLLIRQSESLRLLALGSYFARVVRRRGLAHLHGTYGTRTTTL